MNVLITSASAKMSEVIARGLEGHEIRLTDDPKRATADVVACDLGHNEATDRLCEGIDAIVLVNEPSDLTDSEIIDASSRKIYNLLTAAVEAGVGHVVLVSSLCLFDAVDSAFEVHERWAPAVTPEPAVLRYHVAEFVCREFARANQMSVTCLRFGAVEKATADDAVSEAAVGEAVSAAVSRALPGWKVFHVVSAGSRFLTDDVEEQLGVQPRGDA